MSSRWYRNLKGANEPNPRNEKRRIICEGVSSKWEKYTQRKRHEKKKESS